MLGLVHEHEIGGAANFDEAGVELAHAGGIAGGEADRLFGRQLAQR